MFDPQTGARPNRSNKSILKKFVRNLNPVRALRTRTSTRDSATNSDSRGRRALQSSIVVLDVAFSVAETIPVFGPSLKGALEALCKVLRIVEQRFQNAEAAAKLAERLAVLILTLSKLRASHEVLQRLLSRLLSIQQELLSFLCTPGVRYATIAGFLTGLIGEVDSCQLDFLTATGTEILVAVRSLQMEKLATECVTVLDPYGFPQRILRADIWSIKFVADAILNRYGPNPEMKKALNEFVTFGLYELTMDDGREMRSLTDGSMSSVSQGTKLVMNVVMLQVIQHQGELRCPTCKGPMPISEGGDREVCTTCDRRVSAMKSKDPSADAGKQVQHADSIENLFRNIVIRHRSTSLAQELLKIRNRPTVGSDGSCQLFNNIVQASYGNLVRPIVLGWEVNDPEVPWHAQARILDATDPTQVVAIMGNGTARTRKQAKDMAAREACGALYTQYPGLAIRL